MAKAEALIFEVNPSSFHVQVEDFRRALIRRALLSHRGNRSRAARSLALQRTYLLTSPIQERREALERRHRDALDALDAEEAIARFCPQPPTTVHFASAREPWICYTAADLAEAVAIIQCFTPLPGRAVDDGCVYVGPTTPTDRGTVRFEAPELVEVKLEHFARSHRTQAISLWSTLGDKVARIKIEVKGWPWACLPQCSVTYDRHGDVIRASRSLPDLGEWRRIKWSSGSPDSCHFSLYFDTRQAAVSWLGRRYMEAQQGNTA